MEKTKEYVVLALHARSEVVISHDLATNEFVGKISGYTGPGGGDIRITEIQPEEIRDVSEESLMNRCKLRVAQLIGPESYWNWNEIKGSKLDKSFYVGHSLFRVQCTNRTESGKGELWRFKYWELYDSISIGKDESHLIWYKDSEPAAVFNKDEFFANFRVRGRQDPMVKIRDYDVETENAAFTFEVFTIPGSTELVGRFEGHTPGTLMPIGPGERYPEMKPIKEESIHEADEEGLIEKCKQRMIELGGPITHFIDNTFRGSKNKF